MDMKIALFQLEGYLLCCEDSLNIKEFSCFVFCDFSKPFGKEWHRGFIHKMNSYGIQGKLIKWVENYLLKRRQKVINKNSW
jgi:hypothetical protein